MDKADYFEAFFNFIETEIDRQSLNYSIAYEVKRLEREGGIPAQESPGTGNFEEIFSSVFLANPIAEFHKTDTFLNEFGLSEAEVKSGLAYDGWQQEGQEKFGSSPTVSVGFKTILSKAASSKGTDWRKIDSKGGLSNLTPCPDIAFKQPLPFTTVGDVKYFKGKMNSDQILNELYKAIREVFFYYSAINIGRETPVYKNGMLIVADATTDQAVLEIIRKANPGLEERLFQTPGFYMKILSVT